MSALLELSPRTQDSSQEYLDFRSEIELEQPQIDLVSLFFETQYLALDMRRGIAETAISFADPVTWCPTTPRERKNIILLPGYSASNSSLYGLSNFLTFMGHRPEFALSGQNLIQKANHDEAKDTIVRKIHETGKGVTIVGHSAGGMLGAILQSEINQEEGKGAVAQVITAGSPVAFPFIPVGNEGSQLVTQNAFQSIRRDPEFAEMTRLAFTHLQTPRDPGEMVNFWSRTDPVVNHEYAHRPDALSVEVQASHTGFTGNIHFMRGTKALLAA